jgi:hypothetical protein
VLQWRGDPIAATAASQLLAGIRDYHQHTGQVKFFPLDFSPQCGKTRRLCANVFVLGEDAREADELSTK